MKSFLTKSKFTLALDCPTKLYYATHSGYKSTLEDNDFLQALAKGGIQVGELAKLYYPGGICIDTLDYEEALQQTNDLLEQKQSTIYEAAIQNQSCFIRVDILQKKNNTLQLIEVKSKSWEPNDSFLTQSGTIYSHWQKHLYDVAFQYWVMLKAFPDYEIRPYLMLIDKTQEATVDGLHQNFKVIEEGGRFKVVVKDGVTANDLGDPILQAISVQKEVNLILSGQGREPMSEIESEGFDHWVQALMEMLQQDKKYLEGVGDKCKKCEFRISLDQLQVQEGYQSGFMECWKSQMGWTDEHFKKPHVFDIWNERSVQKKYLDKQLYLMEDLVPDHLPADLDSVELLEPLSNAQRQTIQIMTNTELGRPGDVLLSGLYEEMERWTWPLHFIDFEAVLTAIPFHRGLPPYTLLPFQFSCHTMYEDGKVEHRADWIEEEPGAFPSFKFTRHLKACLEIDQGTVFRYHNFENTVLEKVTSQLSNQRPPDWQELTAWVDTLTRGGDRKMVDLYQVIKDYYYSKHMGGSISIKKVLPAVLTESDFLKEKYSHPYSGLYLKDKVFYQKDQKNGKAISPYKLLDSIDHGLPEPEQADHLLEKTDEVIAEGGTAMMAWSRLQFGDILGSKRKAILQSLYGYCELDTLAMVMITEHWLSKR